MFEDPKSIVQSVEDLKISPLYEELFRHFKIPRDRLYRKIKHEGLNEYSMLKIRRTKKKGEFEILCGVGRYDAVRQLKIETKLPNIFNPEVRCQIVERKDDEGYLALILSENIDTKRFFKNFSPFQFYLLYRLNEKFPASYLPRDYVLAEFDTKPTIYQYLITSYDFVIDRIKELHPEFAETLAKEAAENPLIEKLQDLKLINHALDQNLWKEFAGFFHDSIKISVFYKMYCGGEKSAKKEANKKAAALVETQNDALPANEPIANPDEEIQGEQPQIELPPVQQEVRRDERPAADELVPENLPDANSSEILETAKPKARSRENKVKAQISQSGLFDAFE